MTVQDIYQAVRLCFDEEERNDASIASGGDNTLMNNIIRAKIGDALRWVCLYAPADLLGGSDETEEGEERQTGIITDTTATPTSISGTSAGKITLPSDFIKLVRVRISGWHRAVRVPFSEDSEEYLQLYDENGATATSDRPQAAIIEKSIRELEVWPTGNTAEITYISAVDAENAIYEEGEGTETVEKIALPPRAKSSFIYYLAFLVLSAYEDSRATRMLEIAKMSFGIEDRK